MKTVSYAAPRVTCYGRCWSCGDVKTKPAHPVVAARGYLHWRCLTCQVSWNARNQPELAREGSSR